MNAAARVVSGTKYDRGLTHMLHSELHWLDMADRVTYCTSLGWRCTCACMARHRIICLSCVHQSLKLLNDSIFVPPAPSTRCSTVSARYLRPSQLRCRWTNDMELVPKQFAWAEHANWLFSSYIEDVSFWSVLSTLSALEALLATMRYINWHWHLHYIWMTARELSLWHSIYMEKITIKLLLRNEYTI